MYIDNQTIVQIFYKMLKARLFEEKVAQLKEQGRISAPLYFSLGQEATAAAVCALNSDDIIFASHRNSTVAIAADLEVRKLLAEWAGLPYGMCKGHAGGTSFADNTLNFYGATALAGGNFAKAVGVALSLKLQKIDSRVICFAGEGACADGVFYEAMNFAAIQNLPVIFFIENNCYTERSSVDKIHNISDLAERAKGYGFPGLIVDGNNAVEIYGAMKKALEYATTAKQPVLIESKTYRLAGHTLDDDQTYRSYEEVKEWLDYDPIDNMADYMIENKIGIQDDLLMIREKIEEELNNEIDFLITSQDENKSENLTVAGDFSTES